MEDYGWLVTLHLSFLYLFPRLVYSRVLAITTPYHIQIEIFLIVKRCNLSGAALILLMLLYCICFSNSSSSFIHAVLSSSHGYFLFLYQRLWIHDLVTMGNFLIWFKSWFFYYSYHVFTNNGVGPLIQF